MILHGIGIGIAALFNEITSYCDHFICVLE
mgnify:CR=1 FL=1